MEEKNVNEKLGCNIEQVDFVKAVNECTSLEKRRTLKRLGMLAATGLQAVYIGSSHEELMAIANILANSLSVATGIGVPTLINRSRKLIRDMDKHGRSNYIIKVSDKNARITSLIPIDVETNTITVYQVDSLDSMLSMLADSREEIARDAKHKMERLRLTHLYKIVRSKLGRMGKILKF